MLDNAILSDIINSLDPEDRENVTYIDETGKVLVNKESLRQEVISLEPVSQVTYKNSNSSLTSVTDTTYKNNRYKDSTGQLYTLPVLQPKPACMGNHSLTPMDFSTNSASFPECRNLRNGPYRSVWSHIGFAWASTRVHLPSAREIRDNNSGYNGSTGFIYMGPIWRLMLDCSIVQNIMTGLLLCLLKVSRTRILLSHVLNPIRKYK